MFYIKLPNFRCLKVKFGIFVIFTLSFVINCKVNSEETFDYENGPEADLVNNFFNKFKAERARIRLQDEGHLNISQKEDIKKQLTTINSRIDTILDVMNDPNLNPEEKHFFDDIEVQIRRLKGQMAEVVTNRGILKKQYRMDEKEIGKIHKLSADNKKLMEDLLRIFEMKIGRKI